jgi:hypothetical protein
MASYFLDAIKITIGEKMKQTSKKKHQFFIRSMVISGFFTITSTVYAGPEIIAVEGAHYTINASMMQNLNGLMGKTVVISLNNGKNLTGVVKNVGDHLVHLEKLRGKEFYDALVRISDIQAIETRFRQYKR